MKIHWPTLDSRELAAIVTETLRESGIDALLVGGACVSIYTVNKYISGDLDFVSHGTIKEITKALEQIGFRRESSRHFVRDNCPFFIEFVAPPAAVGNEPVTEPYELVSQYGKIFLLSPTDTVKDRLAAYYHWNDSQALEQAVMVVQAQPVNISEIERWSRAEGFNGKYRGFLQACSPPSCKQ